MKTIVTDSPEEAASHIRAGSLAAFPTETVYGLGADAFDEAGVQQIFDAKGRPSDNPLIVHVHDFGQLGDLTQAPPAAAKALIERFFPGPLTIILPKSDHVPEVVTARLDTVGIRMPDHPVARAFLKACTTPVAAPSANRSGRPSPTTWQAVMADLDGRIPCVLKGGRSKVGLESTVVDCTASPALILRAGAVSPEQLRMVVPDIVQAVASNDEPARSPGVRHRHYAPSAAVEIVAGSPAAPVDRAAYIGLDPPASTAAFHLVRICPSVEAYAYELFDFFRRCDEHGVERIYCQRVDEAGIGLALMDRMRRAAQADALQ